VGFETLAQIFKYSVITSISYLAVYDQLMVVNKLRT